jgi:CheY-like chemotaxis protein
MRHLKELFIIIAEDDVDDGELVLESFIKHDAFSQAILVKNGLELMQNLEASRDNLPDIILTDINMPIKGGIEVLTELFQDPEFCRIPVFIYSSTLNPTYEEKCKELGSIGYLIKPFNLAAFDEIPYQLLYALKKSMMNLGDVVE